APPYAKIAFGDQDLEIDLTRRGAKSRKGAIACTEPLVGNGDGNDAASAMTWRQLSPGTLLIIREGAVIAERATGGPLTSPREHRRPARARPKTVDVVDPPTH